MPKGSGRRYWDVGDTKGMKQAKQEIGERLEKVGRAPHPTSVESAKQSVKKYKTERHKLMAELDNS